MVIQLVKIDYTQISSRMCVGPDNFLELSKPKLSKPNSKKNVNQTPGFVVLLRCDVRPTKQSFSNEVLMPFGRKI